MDVGWILLNYLAAATSDGTQWGNEIGKIGLGAAVGFASAYALERVKRRREPHRQLSWEGSTIATLPEALPVFRGKLDVRYQGTAIENLWEIHCAVENTGNRVIKDQFLRFKLPTNTKVLEAILDPEPEPEIGVSVERLENAPAEHPQYRIAHLERRQSVKWRLIVTGPNVASWEPVTRNNEGDVEFVERSAQRAQEDAEHIAPFLLWFVLLMFLPPAVNVFLSLTDLLASFISLVLLGLIARHIVPVGRVLADVARRATAERGPVHEQRIQGSRNVQIYDVHGSTVDISLARGDQDPAATDAGDNMHPTDGVR